MAIMLASPIQAPSRRPPFFFLALTLIFGVFAFSTLFRGIYSNESLLSYSRSRNDGSWLILTLSRANHLQRRHIIRNTWQKLYGEDGLFDAKFVIADPGPLWRPLIEQENATYGDILMTDHEFESSRYSTTTKTIEAFQKIMMNRKKYTFVSRLDEDSFLDAKTFHSVWLAPLIASHTTQDVYIGRKEQHMYPFKFASAQFYTLSWDMVVALTNLWFLNHMEDEREDVMMGRLLYEGDIRYNLTVLPYRASFEYDLEGESGDGSAWANPLHFVDDASSHAISAGSVNVAHLKDDDLYLRVAACFDENGVALEDNSVNWGRYMSTEEGWTVGWRDL